MPINPFGIHLSTLVPQRIQLFKKRRKSNNKISYDPTENPKWIIESKRENGKLDPVSHRVGSTVLVLSVFYVFMIDLII